MKNIPAFTLIETLVAIAVLSIVITIPFQSAEEALVASYNSRDELVASALAQEDIEFVRDIRDSNYIRNYYSPGSRNWLSSLDGTAGGVASSPSPAANCLNNYCAANDSDAGSLSITQCSNSTCSTYPMYIDSNGWYNQSSSPTGTQTQFYRSFKLTTISTQEVKVSVNVTWSTNHTPHTVTVTDYIDNWGGSS